MEDVHKYRILAWWASGRSGIAKTDASPNAIHFSAPPQFGGIEGRWTPEHLMLTALASCFTTTFRAIAEYSKFDYRDLQVEAEGEVRKVQSGYVFGDIILRPTLGILDPSKRERALALLNRAKAACMVSRCLATPPALEPSVEVYNEVPAFAP